MHRFRMLFALTLLSALAATAAVSDPVKTESGLVSGADGSGGIRVRGATHAAELPYMFQNLAPGPGRSAAQLAFYDAHLARR